MAEVGAESQTYDVKQKIGKTLENYIKSNFTKESVKSALVASSPSLGSNPELTDADWEDVKVSVTVGASNSQFGRISISMNDIVSSAISNGQLAENKYINVQLTLKKRAPSHNYLRIKLVMKRAVMRKGRALICALLFILMSSSVVAQAVPISDLSRIDMKLGIQNRLKTLSRPPSLFSDDRGVINYLTSLTVLAMWNQNANNNTNVEFTQGD